MSGQRLTSATLKRDVLTQVMTHDFLNGPGAPLFFLWVVGAGALLTVFQMPLMALLLSGVFAGIGGFMARDRLANRRVRSEALRLVVGRRTDAGQLSDSGLREALRKGTDVFVELSIKTLDIVEGHGHSDDLERVLGDASEMLTLQCESVRRVEDYRRVVALIEPAPAASHTGRCRNPRAMDGERSLRERNLETVERSATEETALVTEIGEKLETLMLQVLQMERRTSDLVKAAQVAEEASDTLRSLQVVVTTRRETAETIRRMVTTGLG